MNERNLETAVRTGDVYGILIEHFAQAKDYRKVRVTINTSCMPHIVISPIYNDVLEVIMCL